MDSKPVLLDVLFTAELPCDPCPPGSETMLLRDVLVVVHIEPLQKRVYCRIRAPSGLDYHGLMLAKNLCDQIVSKRIGREFHGFYQVIGVRLAGGHPRLAELVSGASVDEPLLLTDLEDELREAYESPGVIEWPGLAEVTMSDLENLLKRSVLDFLFGGWDEEDRSPANS